MPYLQEAYTGPDGHQNIQYSFESHRPSGVIVPRFIGRLILASNAVPGTNFQNSSLVRPDATTTAFYTQNGREEPMLQVMPHEKAHTADLDTFPFEGAQFARKIGNRFYGEPENYQCISLPLGSPTEEETDALVELNFILKRDIAQRQKNTGFYK